VKKIIFNLWYNTSKMKIIWFKFLNIKTLILVSQLFLNKILWTYKNCTFPEFTFMRPKFQFHFTLTQISNFYFAFISLSRNFGFYHYFQLLIEKFVLNIFYFYFFETWINDYLIIVSKVFYAIRALTAICTSRQTFKIKRT
jgi:hypothetical protein